MTLRITIRWWKSWPKEQDTSTTKTLRNPLLRDGLKEIYYGEWEDRTPEDVQANDADNDVRWLTEPAWNPPTAGETAVQVASWAALVR